MLTYLLIQAHVGEQVHKRASKVDPGMRLHDVSAHPCHPEKVRAGTHLGHLDNVKDDTQSRPLNLQMDREGHERAVVWGSPGVGGEMEAAGIGLQDG